MYQKLSSLQTVLMKFVYPVVFGIVAAYNLISLAVSGNLNKMDFTSLWFFMLFGFAFFAFVYWTCVPLKKIGVDDKFLYISNFREEVSVPLSYIKDVKEIVWLQHHPVTIYLKTPTQFGDKIIFMPKFRFLAFYSSHPVVRELKQLAEINNRLL